MCILGMCNKNLIMNRKIITTICVVLCTFTYLTAQVNVKIFPQVQRYIGNVSDLDRSKYFNIHALPGDPFVMDFCKEYNVGFGRGFWGPGAEAIKQTGSVGKYPIESSFPRWIADGNNRYVATEQAQNVFKEGVDADGFSKWAVKYFKNMDDSKRPSWYEPMNEPFVKARRFYDEPDWDSIAEDRVKRAMANVYKQIGLRIREEPKLAKMKVIGYSAAWPEFERDNFTNWEDNMKMFMDVAGEHMDAISYHLYDGVNVVGQYNIRSGSNNDAIMDLIETYSYAKWEKIKPHAITEYGGILNKEEFSVINNIQSVRSQNAMIFGLLEREDRMEISIPFTVDKALWHITKDNNYMPYNSVLIRPLNVGVPVEKITGWVYTDRINFYKLWKNVKGKRVFFHSDNPDIQVQAFVEGKTLYVAFNNLDVNTQHVKIDIPDFNEKLKQVLSKSLIIYHDKLPHYVENVLKEAPNEIVLQYGQTIVLEYSFARNIKFNEHVIAKRYYNSQNVIPIVANNELLFEYPRVDSGEGFASLSMSIGRDHRHSKSPEILVNGNRVEVPLNWKGYDQIPRKDFFGAIEIPFPIEYLSSNNSVSVTFPDTGGHLSSLILNVEKLSSTKK